MKNMAKVLVVAASVVLAPDAGALVTALPGPRKPPE